jgi:hypothetical protein
MFINLTPHQITIQVDECLGLTFPGAATPARVQMIEGPADSIGDIPAVTSRPGPVTGIPGARPGTYYIVSRIVFDAAPWRKDLVAPDTGTTAIREAGQVIAVTRLVRRRP